MSSERSPILITALAIWCAVLALVTLGSCGLTASEWAVLDKDILRFLTFLVCRIPGEGCSIDSAVYHLPIPEGEQSQVQVSGGCDDGEEDCTVPEAEPVIEGPSKEKIHFEVEPGPELGWLFTVAPVPSKSRNRSRIDDERVSFILGSEDVKAAYLVRFRMEPAKRFVGLRRNYFFVSVVGNGIP